MLLILHVGYGWLAAALLLLGASNVWDAVPESAALHALTAGAIGTMTLAVMTRASLGHTGREIIADRAVVAIYCAVSLGAVLESPPSCAF
ncbi:MAG: NnrS family protein [Mesorhizobium sp.]|nr:MAG: NnrS family protein [Mesorhizobium sp.]